MSAPTGDQPAEEKLQASERFARLNPIERGLAAVVGLVLAAFGFVLVFLPPDVTTTVTLEKCAAAADCVTDVTWQSETVVGAVFLAAVIALLAAIIGVRFTRIKFGDNELSSDAPETKTVSETDAEQETVEAAEASRKAGYTASGVKAMTLDTKALHPISSLEDVGEVIGTIERVDPENRPVDGWDIAPDWARDSVENFVESNEDFDPPASIRVASAWKLPGQGNKPWFFRIERIDGTFKVLQVSRGRPKKES
jgi:hypothetical protein